jgi:hypothetical protein
VHQNETAICAVHRGSKHADLSSTSTTACNKPQQDVQSVQNRQFFALLAMHRQRSNDDSTHRTISTCVKDSKINISACALASIPCVLMKLDDEEVCLPNEQTTSDFVRTFFRLCSDLVYERHMRWTAHIENEASMLTWTSTSGSHMIIVKGRKHYSHVNPCVATTR